MNSPAADPRTPVDCLLHWAQKRPDAIYLTQPIRRGEVVDYSWRQVADQSLRMAAYLVSLKLPPRSHIALLGKNSAHWIMADLAIWMAGHVSVPLYPTASAETVRYVLEHCEAKLIFIGKLDELWSIVEPGISAALPRIKLPLAPDAAPQDWDAIIARTAPLSAPLQREPGELATILYTSGSTGQPKGVMISFATMLAAARGMSKMFSISTADRALSYLPLAHAAERAVLEVPSLYFGVHLYFAWSLDSFVEDLQRARPTVFFSVPRLWTRFYQGVCEKFPPKKQALLFRIPLVSKLVKRKILRQLGLQHARMAITGSAPLAPSLVAWYREIGLELLEGYAMTENFAYSHGNLPGTAKIGTVGRCNPDVRCRIDANGEILVHSPAQMTGYYKQPELTAEVMTADGFFRTGDIGRIDADGYLVITGRVKELFKTAKGKYVAPVPIENRLARHPRIEAVCVTGVGMPQPYALAMLSAESHSVASQSVLDGELAALLDEVNATLEDHEKIAFIAVAKMPWTMENGTLTPTMKIRRNVIEGRYAAMADTWFKRKQPVVRET
ncbi:MAG: AMP-binding protein [Pseudomonadota bacterium]|nr:AMP-binding protein [Pseudomonadota bacterium]